MGALLNAVAGIRTRLDESGLVLDLFPESDGDTGFPRYVPDFGDRDFTREIERYIDEQMANYVEERKAPARSQGPRSVATGANPRPRSHRAAEDAERTRSGRGRCPPQLAQVSPRGPDVAVLHLRPLAGAPRTRSRRPSRTYSIFEGCRQCFFVAKLMMKRGATSRRTMWTLPGVTSPALQARS